MIDAFKHWHSLCLSMFKNFMFCSIKNCLAAHCDTSVHGCLSTTNLTWIVLEFDVLYFFKVYKAFFIELSKFFNWVFNSFFLFSMNFFNCLFHNKFYFELTIFWTILQRFSRFVFSSLFLFFWILLFLNFIINFICKFFIDIIAWKLFFTRIFIEFSILFSSIDFLIFKFFEKMNFSIFYNF